MQSAETGPSEPLLQKGSSSKAYGGTGQSSFSCSSSSVTAAAGGDQSPLRLTQSEVGVAPSAAENLLVRLALLFGVLGCGAVACGVALGKSAGTVFAWHPVLLALAFLAATPLGVAVAVRARTRDYDAVRARLLHAHMGCQLVAVALAAGGLAAVYRSKEEKGKPHVATLHAQAGIVALLLFLVVPVLGVLSFKSLGVGPRCFDPPGMSAMKRTHRLWGGAGSFVASCVALSGAWKTFGGVLWGAAVVLIGGCAVCQAGLLYRRRLQRL